MKKLLFIIIAAVMCISCPGTIPQPTNGDQDGDTEGDTTNGDDTPQAVPLKIIALGDDYAMGIQSAGLVSNFQLNSFPYLIAKQAGLSETFQQPTILSPGIGIPPYSGPLQLDVNNQIVASYLDPNLTDEQFLLMLVPRLGNPYVGVPYHNLGVNGAKLTDAMVTTGSANSQPQGNFFFDIVLRNIAIPHTPPFPYFSGMHMVQEAVLLHSAKPTDQTIILLWLGINDIVGAAITGGTIISTTDFETNYRALLTAVQAISLDIVIANIPKYVPFFYALDGAFEVGNPVIFSNDTLLKRDLDPPNNLYVQLLTEETGVKHIMLTAGIEYRDAGLGIPTESALQGANVPQATIDALITDQNQSRHPGTRGSDTNPG